MPLRYRVGRAVRVVDAEAAPHGVGAVEAVLLVFGLVEAEGLVHGRLPEQDADALLVQAAYHARGVGPGTAREVEVLE